MTIKSQKALGKLIDRTQECISGYVRRNDWPVRRNSPWSPGDLKKIKIWLITLEQQKRIPEGEILSPVMTKVQSARYELYNEKAMLAKMDRLVREGEYLKKSDVELGRVKRIHAVKAGLMRLVQFLPKQLVGMTDEAEIGNLIESQVREICDGFARND